ncbi:DUF423 domain-containing protein [Thauera chlorobenzoica]|uniref:Membrane protein, YgdD-like n=1 Tax=Thauera chlorobenzoica TaxID=96773 RepID=A0A1H5S0M3_9RHOO|nr:DUF423 domain-containing protein [Thauera chlorobenzoica]APR05063.1 membrane protein, YgdD-like [Thauera chlorobenzoica]SEF43458.1 Uncharacterized membrane protein YgdD, TMEM256/DUF423 family [Thauera chlorobenzoica]
MNRIFLFIGALSACIAVGLGAFGAHGLRGRLEADMLAVFETGVRYQMYHALALVALGLAQRPEPGRLAAAAGGLFIAGSLCFSGSLYLITLAGARGIGLVTPAGGLMLLAGWLVLALAALKSARTAPPPGG